MNTATSAVQITIVVVVCQVKVEWPRIGYATDGLGASERSRPVVGKPVNLVVVIGGHNDVDSTVSVDVTTASDSVELRIAS